MQTQFLSRSSPSVLGEPAPAYDVGMKELEEMRCFMKPSTAQEQCGNRAKEGKGSQWEWEAGPYGFKVLRVFIRSLDLLVVNAEFG